MVVFLGVSMAFLADSYRDSLLKQQQAQRIYQALEEELGDHVTQGQIVLDRYVAVRDEWIQKYERGEKPTPWFIPWNAEGPPLEAWDAVRSGGGINLIEPDLFFSLIKYYRMVDQFLIQVDGPDRFAEDQIIPFLHLGSGHFYNHDSLYPKYRAYLDRRDLVLSKSQNALNYADSLIQVFRINLD